MWLRLSNNYTGSEHDKEIVEQLATDLNVALAPDNAGEVESKALVDGYGILYMYGADADKIASLALPVIRKLQPRPGSYAVLRYGPSGNPSVRTKRVLLRD